MGRARKKPPPPGFKWIFRPYRLNPKTGRLEYPHNGRVFRMLVPDK